ncbi:MAG: glycerophosphodiester phosphodiesterase [Acidimicrobiales bacterium]
MSLPRGLLYPQRRPIGFAHRGGKAHRPENTLDAFTHARSLGSTALESDVWVTADGIPVLDHDGNVRNRWRNRPIDTVLRGDLPPHIPALADLYATCGTDFELSLDVKDDVAAEVTIAVAEQHGAIGRLWLCTPSRRALKRWRERSEGVRLVDSVPARTFAADPIGRIRALAPIGIDALNARHRAWNHELVAAVHDEGKLAFAWDVQSRTTMARLVDMGIDGLFSDHVDRLVQVLSGPRGVRGG